MWAAAFCKTQYAVTLAEHRWVAELIRSLASVADYAHVYDEGVVRHFGPGHLVNRSPVSASGVVVWRMKQVLVRRRQAQQIFQNPSSATNGCERNIEMTPL